MIIQNVWEAANIRPSEIDKTLESFLTVETWSSRDLIICEGQQAYLNNFRISSTRPDTTNKLLATNIKKLHVLLICGFWLFISLLPSWEGAEEGIKDEGGILFSMKGGIFYFWGCQALVLLGHNKGN